MERTDCSNWIVAWICCFMTFVHLGVARLSGLLFVVVMDSYGVNRSEASLPFVLCHTVRNIAGPLIGYLGRRLGLRKVCVAGCIVSTLGIGLCFFAENVMTVTILWGGVFGLGLGLSTVLIPEILRQHFTKDIAKANGIAFGGECLAGFLLPVLFEVTLKTYGTQGTFLILSGLVLNSIPTALLLKNPKKHQSLPAIQTSQNIIANNTNVNSNEEIFEENKSRSFSKISVLNRFYSKIAISDKRLDRSNSISEHLLGTENQREIDNKSCYQDCATYLDSSDNNALLQNATDHIEHNLSQNGEIFQEKTLRNKKASHSTKILPYSFKKSHNFHSGISKSCTHLDSKIGIDSLPNLRHQSSDPINNRARSFNQHESSSSQNSFYKTCRSFTTDLESSYCEIPKSNVVVPITESTSPIKSFAVFMDLTFIIILFIQSSFIYIATMVLTVVVDYSKDIGVLEYEQIYIVMGMSITDMIGRFSLGFVTDSSYMTPTAFSCTGFIVMGILLFSSIWIRGFVLLMIVMLLFALLIGGLLIVFPSIVAEYIEEDKITMALASRLSLYGPFSLTQSPLIGYFRGNLGSYDGVFYMLSVLCFLCSLLTLLTPFAAKRRSRLKEKKNCTTNESGCLSES